LGFSSLRIGAGQGFLVAGLPLLFDLEVLRPLAFGSGDKEEDDLEKDLDLLFRLGRSASE